MYFIITKRMLEVCFSTHPNIQYRTLKEKYLFLNFLETPLYRENGCDIIRES